MQNLFSQIGKEYTVVKRYRRPVGDALKRLERNGGLIDNAIKGKATVTGPQERRHRGSHGSTLSRNSGRSQHDQTPHRSNEAHRSVSFEPQPLQKRKSRVAFNIPPARDDDDDLDEDHPRSRDGIVVPGGVISDEEEERGGNEALDICRRMWVGDLAVGLVEEG